MFARQINLSQSRPSVPEKVYVEDILAVIDSRASAPGTVFDEGVSPSAFRWQQKVPNFTTKLDDPHVQLVNLLASAQEDLNRLHDIVRPAGYDVVVWDIDGLVVYRHDPQEGSVEKASASPTCVSAARIFDHEGNAIASLGVSSIDSDLCERSQLVIGAVVQASARAIEERAFRARYRSEWIVTGVRRAGVRSGIVFAVDSNQRVVGADRDARAMLLRAGYDVGENTSLWSLFERDLSLFQPMHAGDVLGSLRSVGTDETWWALVTSPEPARGRCNNPEPASAHRARASMPSIRLRIRHDRGGSVAA